MKLAVLLTTYNRRQKTITCLERLEKQVLPPATEVTIFLTDDHSQDGTADAVKALFPSVHVFHGDGKLYWAGGMRKTWREAMKYDPDYYLLLNDDTVLFDDCIARLLAVAVQYHPCICIGSTMDAQSGQLSYGGWKLTSARSWKSKRIMPVNEVVDCDFANANIMLVAKEVIAATGILADNFTHALADYDYCLTARKQGFAVKLAPGFLGSCTDDHPVSWKTGKSTLKERIQYLKSPKGLSYTELLYFIRKHFPVSYPAVFVKLWMKTFFPVIWDRYKR